VNQGAGTTRTIPTNPVGIVMNFRLDAHSGLDVPGDFETLELPGYYLTTREISEILPAWPPVIRNVRASGFSRFRVTIK